MSLQNIAISLSRATESQKQAGAYENLVNNFAARLPAKLQANLLAALHKVSANRKAVDENSVIDVETKQMVDTASEDDLDISELHSWSRNFHISLRKLYLKAAAYALEQNKVKLMAYLVHQFYSDRRYPGYDREHFDQNYESYGAMIEQLYRKAIEKDDEAALDELLANQLHTFVSKSPDPDDIELETNIVRRSSREFFYSLLDQAAETNKPEALKVLSGVVFAGDDEDLANDLGLELSLRKALQNRAMEAADILFEKLSEDQIDKAFAEAMQNNDPEVDLIVIERYASQINPELLAQHLTEAVEADNIDFVREMIVEISSADYLEDGLKPKAKSDEMRTLIQSTADLARELQG